MIHGTNTILCACEEWYKMCCEILQVVLYYIDTYNLNRIRSAMIDRLIQFELPFRSKI
jgi:hypothetical protein